MSLLDGRYEVIAQRTLDGGLTLFEATAPDGAPLRIEWFELPPEREAEFENYRRLLRRLKQAGVAAVHDVVGRPGAHYVAWERVPVGATPVSSAAAAALTLPGLSSAGAGPADLGGVLAAAGYSLEACDLRRTPARPQKVGLYGLAFGPSGASAPSARQVHVDEGQDAARGRPLKQHRPPLKRGAEAIAQLPPRVLSWGLAGMLALAAVLVGAVAFRSSAVDAVVTVPAVVGLDARAAVDHLTALGLGVNATPIVSDEAPGTVLAVDPAVGAYLRPGRTVVLRYALGAGQLAPAEVPALIGLAYPDEARAALQRAGLRLGEVARLHAASPPGTVLAQDVDPGSRTGTDAPVAVLVSMGPEPVQTFVPDLVGLDLETARALAQVAGIGVDRVFVDEIVSSSGERGTVLNQSLAPYVPVSRDEAVLRLVVQSGEPASPALAGGAPDVVGLGLAAARKVANGWDVSVVALGNPGLPAGVVAQEPQPGAGAAANGATLVLTVNSHPVPLSTAGVRAEVRRPTIRRVDYAWTIQPGISSQRGEVWASDLEGNRTLVANVTVRGGEILRGSWTTVTAGPVTFELLIGGVPYGERLLVP